MTSTLWNHARVIPAPANPHSDLCLTGWQFCDARGTHMRYDGDWQDNVWESDHRGHCLDATDKLPAGSMISYSNKHVCPLQSIVYR